ncbi:hypothetical protein R3P38DRAFT_3596372 [Favolaschia claudopus]|uniref:Uncharacterized protein n=1 Tax=Favolaschia claudopus TaxID=2862362 RepID=A0AAW0AES3_9AGAR
MLCWRLRSHYPHNRCPCRCPRTRVTIVLHVPAVAAPLGTSIPSSSKIDVFLGVRSPTGVRQVPTLHEAHLINIPAVARSTLLLLLEWKTMDRKPFMKKYGKEVLKQYNIPTAEEIAGVSDSDEDDEDDGSEPEIIDLVDTSEDEDEMEVEEELDP